MRLLLQLHGRDPIALIRILTVQQIVLSIIFAHLVQLTAEQLVLLLQVTIINLIRANARHQLLNGLKDLRELAVLCHCAFLWIAKHLLLKHQTIPQVRIKLARIVREELAEVFRRLEETQLGRDEIVRRHFSRLSLQLDDELVEKACGFDFILLVVLQNQRAGSV